MKLFDADQFIWEPRLRTYKACKSELGYAPSDLIDGLRLRGCPGRNGVITFTLLRNQNESVVLAEVVPANPSRPLKIVLVKG